MAKIKNIITLGIDSSSTNCGVAVFKNGNLITTKNLEFKGTYNLEKLQEIITQFEIVFETIKPDIVILESPAPVRNSKTLTVLNQIAGAIWTTAKIKGAFIDEIHNKTIKRLMNVKSKEDSIKRVKELFDVNVKTDHEADAVLTVMAYEIITTKTSTN